MRLFRNVCRSGSERDYRASLSALPRIHSDARMSAQRDDELHSLASDAPPPLEVHAAISARPGSRRCVHWHIRIDNCRTRISRPHRWLHTGIRRRRSCSQTQGRRLFLRNFPRKRVLIANEDKRELILDRGSAYAFGPLPAVWIAAGYTRQVRSETRLAPQDAKQNGLYPDRLTGEFPAGSYLAIGNLPVCNLSKHCPSSRFRSRVRGLRPRG